VRNFRVPSAERATVRIVQMNLLFDDIEVIETAGDPAAVDVRGIAHDSRRVVPGDLFCCVPGLLSDGHAFAAEAVDRGAVGLLCEHYVPELLDNAVVQTLVAPGTIRPVMARLAAAFYGFPARDLLTIGVTGTNGKTTVTRLLGDLLEATGRPTTVLGTLSGVRTTPEATELQRLLAETRDRQFSDRRPHAVAMEVSSHALAQYRVEGIHFDVAAFTNLSHDHLDYHGTMEEYFAVKSSLFTADHAVRGVINADDPWGRRLLAKGRIPMVAVRRSDASDVVLQPGRTWFTWRGHRVATPLTGAINVDNALLAAEAALALGLDPPEIVAAFPHVSPAPGRFQVLSAPAGHAPDRPDRPDRPESPDFTVVVDYAHTPAGLEVVLREARGLTAGRGRVLVAFGCGGNRDRAKRPKMGRAASLLSDVAVLTSDNPRDEDPLAIIEEVRAGVGADAPPRGTFLVEPDRGAAIRLVLEEARAGDVVVIAGKGHEDYQEIGGVRLPFDDVLEARRSLSARFPSDPSTWVATPSAATAPEGE
jgi:UDP-N-acetylmuramoyl-L-alanyl-D-glutamate--2,6-diaminopimelate ligase